MGHSVVLMPHVDGSAVPVPCAWGPHVPLGRGIALESHFYGSSHACWVWPCYWEYLTSQRYVVYSPEKNGRSLGAYISR